MVGDAITNVKVFSSRKADEMVIVDIEATEKKRINLPLLKRLSSHCIMPLTIGGGVTTLEDAEDLFSVGADKVLVNSAFYNRPEILTDISSKFGRQAVVFSLDVMKKSNEYVPVSKNGSVKQSWTLRETVERAIEYGAGEIILNSVDCDGMMQGFDLNLCKQVSDISSVPVVIAGGCGTKEDCVLAVNSGADAVAAGSIFYWVGESILTIKDYMNKNGLEVRLL
ncbi:hisF protein [Oceanobacter sp. RED65]|uniref:HisF protein n=2 Tax=Bermanella marisrubri TaxID=207949 RepID=Q1N2Y7_9GAMM|nr:hisF protein [Oceanobacter sp. RED65] [Bermanella marisrubri]